ncbi:MAG: FkbM family methyltransferase [Chlamydiia bacterium]|nr:FkbM family methyltransferase [Chlamydiia bacterium]
MRNIKRNFFTMALISLHLCSTAYAVPEKEFAYYSQYEQDKYLNEHVFKNKEHGVFVDIGAHDGITLSNTYFFEQSLGWTGICVEPIPQVFELLKSRRKAICIQGCICDKYKTVPFLQVKGAPEMLSGIVENYDPRHLQRIAREIEQSGGSSEIINVPCFNLNQLLLEHGIQHVDYLSLDTEGGELEILQSIDFSKLDIDVIDVENNYGSAAFRELLEPLGYEKIAHLGCTDEIYRKKREQLSEPVSVVHAIQK